MGYCTCVSSYQLLMAKPVYIVLPLALYLRQIRFVVQRILFLQKFCSLYNFLCTLTFSNQERLFFADVLLSLKSKIAATKAHLKNECEERIKMEEKVKYCSGGNCRSSYKTPIQFFYRGFSNASFVLGGNYDCEPLLGIYSGPNWVVLYI